MPTQRVENAASVLKVFGVLEALAIREEISLGDIAQKAMTSKGTAHRLIRTMVDLGYVYQSESTEKYGLTMKLFGLAARSLNGQSDILRIADVVMGELSRKTGEAINLGVFDPREQCVTYIHKYDSAYNLSLNSTLGLRNPLHSTSLGKALLAWRDEGEIRERLNRMNMVKLEQNTITDKEVLYEQLQRFRKLGYAEEIEESEAGVRCMAAPILDYLGKSVAAISIGFPLFRFDQSKHGDYVELLTQACTSASEQLGYRPDRS